MDNKKLLIEANLFIIRFLSHQQSGLTVDQLVTKLQKENANLLSEEIMQEDEEKSSQEIPVANTPAKQTNEKYVPEPPTPQPAIQVENGMEFGDMSERMKR